MPEDYIIYRDEEIKLLEGNIPKLVYEAKKLIPGKERRWCHSKRGAGGGIGATSRVRWISIFEKGRVSGYRATI